MGYYNWENDEYVSEYDNPLEQEYLEAVEKMAVCYLEENFPLSTPFEQYNTEHHCADTLDEYLMSLIKGHINVSLRPYLDRHLMELLDDKWFFQWPLVHWDYGSRLLRGTGCSKDVKCAVDILLPMARQGIPGALYDIGCCYMDGLQFEQSYTTAIYCWILASKQGYSAARADLHSEYWSGRYRKHKEFDGYVKHAFLCANLNFFMEDHHIDESGWNIEKQLNEWEREELRKLCKRIIRVEDKVLKNAPVLLASTLFWSNDENPYKIHI